MDNKKNNKKYYQLIAGGLIISFSPVVVKLISAGALTTAFYRVFVSALALLLICFFKKDRIYPGLKILLICAAGALFFALDLCFWHASIDFIGPGLATILGNFQVFFMAVIGILLFREKLSWQFLISLPLAMAGIILLCGLKWDEFSPDYKTGILYGFITAVCYTGYILVLRQAQLGETKVDSRVIMLWISVFSSIILFLFCLFIGESLIINSINDGFLLTFYGLLFQTAGWLIISNALPLVPASRAGLILLIQPALSLVWDIVFFKRPTSVLELSGAVLALIAIYLGSYRKKKKVLETD